jgi:cell wall-associated NlpC family hydrolase
LQTIQRYKKEIVGTVVAKIIQEAKEWIGTPYRFGGTSRRGIDCSAFVQTVFQAGSLILPRTSKQQKSVGVPVKLANIQPGDLIFFDTQGRNNGQVTHVGVYAGEGKFFHASSQNGVEEQHIQHPYFAPRITTIRRVIKDNL